MEPEEVVYCYNKENKCCVKSRNFGVVAAIVLALFAITIGMILGASLASTLMTAMAALIVLAISLGVMFITFLVLLITNKCRKEKKCKCCC